MIPRILSKIAMADKSSRNLHQVSTLQSSITFLRVIFAILAIHAVALGNSETLAQEIRYPAKSGIVDITQPPYNAVGDGKTDNTKAIRKAILDHLGERRFIYFPKGVYLVSDRLAWRREEALGGDGTWGCNLAFIGEERAGTIIRLANASPGYNDPSKPRALIYTANEGLDRGFFPWKETGAGNDAFRNHIRNLTVETGANNPGAIGIDYHGHNFSTIEGVTIRSGDGGGVAGLDMTRPHPGPLLIKDVTVSGFDIGVDVADWGYSVTLENLELDGQKVAGLRNNGNVVSIRRLKSLNSGPAILDESEGGLITLVDADLKRKDGSETQAAIVSKADLFARNITAEGYPTAIEAGGKQVAGPKVAEFVSRPVVSLSGNRTTSLDLPVEETPFFHDNDPTHWIYVSDYGAIPNDNTSDHVAIQAAIDSSLDDPDMTTLVFDPDENGNSFYETSMPIKLRGNIRKIVGMNSTLFPHGHPEWFSKGQDLENPVLDLSEVTVDTVFIDDLAISSNKNIAMSIEHNSPTNLVLRSVQANYRSQPGAGTVFFQDFTGGFCFFEAPGQKVFARQLNLEGTGHDKLRNIGANVWVLGLKTERTHREKTDESVIRNTAGGKMEILGSFIYPLNTIPENVPMIINTDASLSISYRTAHWQAKTRYDIEFIDTRDGTTKVFKRDPTYKRSGEGAGGSVVPLVTSEKE